MTDDFNDLLRGAYGASRAKSARPVFHDQANQTPEDVRYGALRAGKSAAEAERLARRHAARHGDDFNALIRNDHAQAQARRRKV
jgi:hypothetical protein